MARVVEETCRYLRAAYVDPHNRHPRITLIMTRARPASAREVGIVSCRIIRVAGDSKSKRGTTASECGKNFLLIFAGRFLLGLY